MKVPIATFFVLLFLQQMCPAQSVQHTVSLDIMTTAVSQSSMDSIPLKVSVPDSVQSSGLKFSITEEGSGGEMFITGTPYDSVQVQVPADISVFNQQREKVELKDFQLLYGTSEDVAAMEVVSPVECITIQIPESGRVHVRLGGTMVSDDDLRGIYTGNISLDCKRE